jgi:hypothetical protein
MVCFGDVAGVECFPSTNITCRTGKDDGREKMSVPRPGQQDWRRETMRTRRSGETWGVGDCQSSVNTPYTTCVSYDHRLRLLPGEVEPEAVDSRVLTETTHNIQLSLNASREMVYEAG